MRQHTHSYPALQSFYIQYTLTAAGEWCFPRRKAGAKLAFRARDQSLGEVDRDALLSCWKVEVLVYSFRFKAVYHASGLVHDGSSETGHRTSANLSESFSKQRHVSVSPINPAINMLFTSHRNRCPSNMLSSLHHCCRVPICTTFLMIAAMHQP
jgi:hypothetical protein